MGSSSVKGVSSARLCKALDAVRCQPGLPPGAGRVVWSAGAAASSSSFAQVGAGKPSERRKRAACSAVRVLGWVPLGRRVQQRAEKGRLELPQRSGGVRPGAPVGSVALLTGGPQSQTSHAQGELGSLVLSSGHVAIATHQHLSQAVLDSGIVGGCEVSGVGWRQRSQQVRATGSCAAQEE